MDELYTCTLIEPSCETETAIRQVNEGGGEIFNSQPDFEAVKINDKPDENTANSTCNIDAEWRGPQKGKSCNLTTLSWAGYNRQLTNGLWTCFEQNFQTDFELCSSSSEHSVKVHYLILSIFCPAVRGGTEKRLSLDVDEDGLNVIVDFLYNGKIRVREDQLEEVKNAAHALGFDVLVDIIQNFVGVEQLKQETSQTPKETSTSLQLIEPDDDHVMKDDLELGVNVTNQQEIENPIPNEQETCMSDEVTVIEAGTNILVCPSCPFSCDSLLGLSNHIAECSVRPHHPDKQSRSNLENPVFKCPLCSTAQVNLEEHLKMGHRMSHAQVEHFTKNVERYTVRRPQNPQMKTTTSGLSCTVKSAVFRCEQCPYVDRYKSNFIRHLKTHKTSKCRECGLTFPPGSISTHKLMMHSGNSANKKKLLLNMSAVEFQNMTNSSPQQHEQLTRPCSVMVNPMAMHVQHVNLACPSCTFVTDSFVQLQKHMDCHVVKLFKCEWCSFECRYLIDLGDHLRRCHSLPSDVTCAETHVQNTSEKPFKCDWCSCAFKTMGNLKAHLMLVH